MQAQVRAVLMRGGTSRALVFRAEDLPVDRVQQDALLLAAMGSPDPHGRQVDGVGGGHPLTSKVAIIGPSARDDTDVDYTFAQVVVDSPTVERRSNCGNISAAVGPFALDEGMVEASEPTTRVRIFNTNTQKLIVAEVPTRGETFDPEGAYELPGVPGSGSRIDLEFMEPGGSLTGALLPTGKERDELAVDGETIPVSIVDAATPAVFVRASDLGLSFADPVERLETDAGLARRLERLRAHAAVAAGLAETPEEATSTVRSVPKLAVVDPADGVDLAVRALTMGRAHRAVQLTSGICLAAAAALPGTVVHSCLAGDLDPTGEGGALRVGHPSGVMELRVRASAHSDGWRLESVTASRTARRLMEGSVFVPAPSEAAVAAGRS
jgi:2-methylaconitate cis-trans-isomerase PrpF